MKNIVTAADIRDSLIDAYSAPEWYLGFEVGNSTGAYARRHADAVAVNAYPSRGFETRGFEIKVTKSDLRSELGNGAKADAVAKYCDYWFLVVPKGLCDGFTLPPTWGVIEYSGGKLTQSKPAQQIEKEPITQGFMCALLRGRDRVNDYLRSVREKEIVNRCLPNLAHAENTLLELRSKLEEIRKATGIQVDEWTPTSEIVTKLKMAYQMHSVSRSVRNLRNYADEIRDNSENIDKVLSELFGTNKP